MAGETLGSLGGAAVGSAGGSGNLLGYDPTNTNLVPWRSTEANFGIPSKPPAESNFGAIYSKTGVVPVQGVGGPGGTNPQWAAANQGVGGFNTPGYQYGMTPAGSIQNSVDPGQDYLKAAQDAYYGQATARLDPQWQQRDAALESKLANMGLTRGSEAWNNEMQKETMGRTDAYNTAMNSAILTSGQEAARLQGMDINAGNFANQAQKQAEDQALARANLNNNALAQQQNIQYQASGAANKAAAAQRAAMGASNANAYQGYLANQTAQQNYALQSRQLADQEALNAFNMTNTAAMMPYNLQNAAMGGMYPTGNPTMPSYAAAGAGPNYGASGAGLGNQYSGAAGAAYGLGSMGGTMFT